jgi:hypothetical protein
MSQTPTFSETYDALLGICNTAQKGLYELGRIRGKNDPPSDEELRKLVLDVSKGILNKLPCLQLEEDAIEDMDSKYSHLLTELAESHENGEYGI